MQSKYFYISTRGAAASTWLANLINNYPMFLAIHGTRSVPPFQSGIADQSSQEFFDRLPEYRDKRKPGAKFIGGIHGYYGITAKHEVEKRGGVFVSIIRHPIKRIHSLFSHHFRNYLENSSSSSSDISVYDIIKSDYLDFRPDRFDYGRSSLIKNIRPVLSTVKTKLVGRLDIPLTRVYKIDGKKVLFTPVEQMFMGICNSILCDDFILMRSLSPEDIYKMEDLVSKQSVCMNLINRLSGNTLSAAEQNIVSLEQHFNTKIRAHTKVHYSIEDTYSLWPDSFKFIYQVILSSLGGEQLVEEYKKRFNYELISISQHRFHVAEGRVEQEIMTTSGV